MNPVELKKWFEHTGYIFETAYLSNEEPWKQSGMSGPEERWISLRKPVADCINKSGSFLDIGCANGYLLECCIKWTTERGIAIEPYGLDISSKLIELTKKRLPENKNNFYIGNSFYWIPQQKFDYVRTELVYVPAEFEKPYIEYLLNNYLKPDGFLLIANYAEEHPHPETTILPGSHPTKRILERLSELGIKTIGHKDGYDPVKGRKIRIAIVTPRSLG